MGVIVMNTILENMMYAIDIQDMNFGFNLGDWDKDRVLDPVYDALVCAGIDNKTFDVQCGVTKVVVIPNDSNFVLKTPLNGCYREVEVDPDYGEERTAALLAFLEENSIDDLHSGNVMISLATNKIVLSDYSGFDN